MSWWRILRAWWAFGARDGSVEARAAVEAASQSHARAMEDKARAALVRAQAEHWGGKVQDHNRANMYDTWLQEVLHGRG